MNDSILLYWLIIAVMTLTALAFLCLPLLKSKSNVKLFIFLIVFLPIAALTGYLMQASHQLVTEKLLADQREGEVKAELAKLGNNENIIKALKQRLQENPDSAEGWYLLGRMYLLTKEYKNAAMAFDKANHLNPNQMEIMLSYAEASFFDHHQTLDAKAEQCVNAVLKIEPSNVNAINLLAINAYQHKKYQQAIDYWRQLLVKFPSNSEDAKILMAMIDEAHRRIYGRLFTTG